MACSIFGEVIKDFKIRDNPTQANQTSPLFLLVCFHLFGGLYFYSFIYFFIFLFTYFLPWEALIEVLGIRDTLRNNFKRNKLRENEISK